MIFRYFLTEIITHPTSPLTVIALEDATLTCLASVGDVTYSWHRVGSSVPSRSIGQNNSTLTIPRATPYDIGVYYCVAERQGISVQSSEAVLRVNGKELYELQPIIIRGFLQIICLSVLHQKI